MYSYVVLLLAMMSYSTKLWNPWSISHPTETNSWGICDIVSGPAGFHLCKVPILPSSCKFLRLFDGFYYYKPGSSPKLKKNLLINHFCTKKQILSRYSQSAWLLSILGKFHHISPIPNAILLCQTVPYEKKTRIEYICEDHLHLHPDIPNPRDLTTLDAATTPLTSRKLWRKDATRMSCWYLVTGWFHPGPYITIGYKPLK